jgi:hypothetical protein
MPKAVWPPEAPPRYDAQWSFHGTKSDGQRFFEWKLQATEGRTYWFLGFDHELMRVGDHYTLLMIPAELYGWIGAVAVHWGHFEQAVDALLAPFVVAAADDKDAGWDRRSFVQRVTILRRRVQERFPGDIAAEVCKILEGGLLYHWQRNLLIHGQVMGHFQNDTVTAVFSGRLKGKPVSMPMPEAHLRRMQHEISVLQGRLADLTAEEGSGLCRLEIDDRTRLRKFLEDYKVARREPDMVQPQQLPDELR